MEYGGVLLNPSSAEVIEWVKQTQPIDTIRCFRVPIWV